MSENKKGLKFYDNLDLTHSHNDEDLQVVYKEWATAYDHDNDNLLGTVSQPLSVQIFQEYIKDKTLRIIDVGCGTGLTTIPWKCKKYGIECIPFDFRHRFFWDCGIHCITLDLARDDKMENFLS